MRSLKFQWCVTELARRAQARSIGAEWAEADIRMLFETTASVDGLVVDYEGMAAKALEKLRAEHGTRDLELPYEVPDAFASGYVEAAGQQFFESLEEAKNPIIEHRMERGVKVGELVEFLQRFPLDVPVKNCHGARYRASWDSVELVLGEED